MHDFSVLGTNKRTPEKRESGGPPGLSVRAVLLRACPPARGLPGQPLRCLSFSLLAQVSGSGPPGQRCSVALNSPACLHASGTIDTARQRAAHVCACVLKDVFLRAFPCPLCPRPGQE